MGFSADNKLVMFQKMGFISCKLSPKDNLHEVQILFSGYFMQIVSIENDLHEISNPNFWEK